MTNSTHHPKQLFFLHVFAISEICNHVCVIVCSFRPYFMLITVFPSKNIYITDQSLVTFVTLHSMMING